MTVLDMQIPTTGRPAELEIEYVIRCPQAACYAIFQPLRQTLSIVRPAERIKLDMGFSVSRLLELLIRRADQLVTREEILAYAWPERVVTQSSLNQAISTVREMLGDEVSKEIIQTVPRRGYQFNARFLTHEGEWPNAGEQVEVVAAAIAPADRWLQRLVLRVWPVSAKALWVLVLCLLGSLLWRVNWTLMLQPGLTSNSQQVGDQRVFYTAPDSLGLLSLQADIGPLRERMLKLADTPGMLLFNRMYDFYDVVCIHEHKAVEFMFIHKSQLLSVKDQELLECLK